MCQCLHRQSLQEALHICTYMSGVLRISFTDLYESSAVAKDLRVFKIASVHSIYSLPMASDPSLSSILIQIPSTYLPGLQFIGLKGPNTITGSPLPYFCRCFERYSPPKCVRAVQCRCQPTKTSQTTVIFATGAPSNGSDISTRDSVNYTCTGVFEIWEGDETSGLFT
jgi:hypothetical protein